MRGASADNWRRLRGAPLRTALAGVVILGVWLPLLLHYQKRTPEYSDQTIKQLRLNPDDGRFDELLAVRGHPRSSTDLQPDQRLDRATQLLEGIWDDPESGRRAVTLPFDAADLDTGTPSQRLRFASLGHVDVLLAGFEASGDIRFLAAARDVVNGFGRYERSALRPRGLLWNDHAIVERAIVAAAYWRHFRNSGIFDRESARSVVELVGRSGAFLMDPAHFTVRTNHGLMQNLGLMHIAAAFPALPGRDQFRRTAIDRLVVQLGFYQSPEGVILEHSAGYQAFGVDLLRAIDRYVDRPADRVQLRIDERIAAACLVLADLAGPDGNLPLFGDTASGKDVSGCPTQDRDNDEDPSGQPGLRVYPIAGYATARVTTPQTATGSTSGQAVVLWSNFTTRSHKHADEMAVVNWLAGGPFLTGVGYWPYGQPLRDTATSWGGSNAPHFDGEPGESERATSLLSFGAQPGLVFLDLQRHLLHTGDSIRRQILLLGAGDLLVLDYGKSPADRAVISNWTLFPGWRIENFSPASSATISNPAAGRDAAVSVASAGRIRVERLVASVQPFGGWVALRPRADGIVPAVSLSVEGRSNQPVFTHWADRGDVEAMQIRSWESPEAWRICVDGSACRRQIERSGANVRLTAEGADQLLSLKPAKNESRQVRQINDRYESATGKFPHWNDRIELRTKATAALLVAFLFQEVSFILLATTASRRWWSSSAVAQLKAVACCCWIVGGVVALAYVRSHTWSS